MICRAGGRHGERRRWIADMHRATPIRASGLGNQKQMPRPSSRSKLAQEMERDALEIMGGAVADAPARDRAAWDAEEVLTQQAASR